MAKKKGNTKIEGTKKKTTIGNGHHSRLPKNKSFTGKAYRGQGR